MLSLFVCTEPPKSVYQPGRGRLHPRPWELLVQSYVRGLRLPIPDDSMLLVGVDQTGIAAVIHFGYDIAGTEFIIKAVATATRCQGLGYGGAAVGQAFQVLRDTQDQYGTDMAVIARIDPRNDPSKAVFKRAGFEYLGHVNDYEEWIRQV